MMNIIGWRIKCYCLWMNSYTVRCIFLVFGLNFVDWYEWERMGFGLCRILQVTGHSWYFAYETVPYAYGIRLIRVWGTLPRGYTRMIRSCPVPRTMYWRVAYESV